MALHILLKEGAKYHSAGMGGVSINLNNNTGRLRKEFDYEDITAVFDGGELKWQNHDLPPVESGGYSGVEVVLHPDAQYKGKRGKSLRFMMPDCKRRKDNLRIVADDVLSVDEFVETFGHTGITELYRND